MADRRGLQEGGCPLTVHIFGFCYKPKDIGVCEGYIRQTIKTPVRADIIRW